MLVIVFVSIFIRLSLYGFSGFYFGSEFGEDVFLGRRFKDLSF